MSKWGDLAKARFLKKPPESTDKNDEKGFLAFSSVGNGGICENQWGFSSFSSVGIGANPEKRMFSDAPANDSQTGAEIDPDRHCYPHTEACNTTELDLMATRLATFARIGMDVDQAEKLADRLKDRDRDPQDDRHICMECQHCQYGRCGNSRTAGLRYPELGTDYALVLKRCCGFSEGAGTLAGAMAFSSLPPSKPLPRPHQGHPLTAEAKQAARDYHTHHFACGRCISAGQGRGERCQRGAELWSAYTAGDCDAR